MSSFATKDESKVHPEEKTIDSIYFSEDYKLYRCSAFMNPKFKEKIRFYQEKISAICSFSFKKHHGEQQPSVSEILKASRYCGEGNFEER